MPRRDDEQRLRYQRGEDSISLKKHDVGQILADAFDNVLYSLVGRTNRADYEWNRRNYKDRYDKNYHRNATFWKETLLSYNNLGQRIKLNDFAVIEWLPSSPGLFFTGKAEKSRRSAEKYIEPYFREYLPLGKLEMVLGGVGSVRLGSEQISNKTSYYLCATSSGASHEGIPLVCERELYMNFISEIKDRGYVKGDIIGRIEVLHTEKSIIKFDRDVPKYCIVVEDFVRSNEQTENINISVATAFQSDRNLWRQRNDSTYTEYSWTFCTFKQGRGDMHLTQAVDWINDYALRYSGSSRIICDFDEHKSHFQNVDFSIQEIMTGRFDKNRLQEFSYINQFNVDKIIMGDNFENIKGTFINRSMISNSFNKVRDQIDEDAAQFLAHITQEVEKSGDKEALELMEEFHQEIQKPEPKKSLLKSFWNGIVSVVPALISNADKMMDVIEKVSKMLPS